MTSATNLKALTATVTRGKRTFVVARPCIVANFYIDAELDLVTPRLAETLQAFLAFIGQSKPLFYAAENGTMKALTAKRVDRDVKFLKKLPSNTDGFDWLYTDAGDGGAGEYAIQLVADEPEDDLPNQLHHVHIAFPPNALELYGEERLLEFSFGEAERLKVQSGNIGWGLERGRAYESEAIEAINKRLSRYLGFDPCFADVAEDLSGHTTWAHWINILDQGLAKACGGKAALKKAAPDARVSTLGGMLVIRASKLPPIGDKNRGAPDIGCLPGVARFLEPRRTPLDGLGDDEFDAEKWLARFDDLPNKSWDNA